MTKVRLVCERTYGVLMRLVAMRGTDTLCPNKAGVIMSAVADDITLVWAAGDAWLVLQGSSRSL